MSDELKELKEKIAKLEKQVALNEIEAKKDNTKYPVYTDVDEFEKEEYIKEYVKNGGNLWSFDNISIIRDGGTIILIRPPKSKLNPFYLHKDYFTLHDDYPTTDDNLVTDKPTQIYVLDRLQKYKRDCEYSLKEANRVIEKIRFGTTM
jgi:hypothetical protein